MSPPDDLHPDRPPASEGIDPAATPAVRHPLKEVGPESEVRGGPEAPPEPALPTGKDRPR